MFVGISVWTKLIRNNTAVDYLFNGETYDFNYQFQHRLPKPIKLYPVRKYHSLILNGTVFHDIGRFVRHSMCLQYHE